MMSDVLEKVEIYCNLEFVFHIREGYKSDQKKRAFAEMEQLGDALKIHAQVVRRAQEEWVLKCLDRQRT